ncbi:hypothetical protein BDP27DRAFT_1370712 [Rhodocollybia butyracea]|uniref:Uncharacterized protein n=1 Tax=Rhodocollybia butyracea TaxID=206335 RepID=A0A9P5P7C1_9AGAR|nr:hypothetical protein BDP27DRAFT_1370712 [Rhodocollybia butyracea]
MSVELPAAPPPPTDPRAIGFWFFPYALESLGDCLCLFSSFSIVPRNLVESGLTATGPSEHIEVPQRMRAYPLSDFSLIGRGLGDGVRFHRCDGRWAARRSRCCCCCCLCTRKYGTNACESTHSVTLVEPQHGLTIEEILSAALGGSPLDEVATCIQYNINDKRSQCW